MLLESLTGRLHILFSGFFEKNYYKVWQTEKVAWISNWLLKSVTKIYFNVTDFTKCDNNLLQTMTVITKWNKIYYKVWQVLKKFDKKLLRSSNRIKDLTE